MVLNRNKIRTQPFIMLVQNLLLFLFLDMVAVSHSCRWKSGHFLHHNCHIQTWSKKKTLNLSKCKFIIHFLHVLGPLVFFLFFWVPSIVRLQRRETSKSIVVNVLVPPIWCRECVSMGAAGAWSRRSPFAPADFEASSTMCTRWFWDPELSRMHLHPQI